MILKTPNYKSAIDFASDALKEKGLTSKLRKELMLQLAGLRAEQQMAYQLQSYFSTTPDLLVLNDLKIKHNNTTAQIDHLVLSRRAIYFIESKSVSDTITVNVFGEWERVYRGKPTSIKSPVEQVKRQKEVLFQFLKANISEVLGKLLGRQKGIGSYTPYLFVAISEKGSIEEKGRKQFADVVKKFDQICSEMKNINSSGAGFMKYFRTEKEEDFNVFSKEQLEDLAELLLKHDISQDSLATITEMVELHTEKETIKDIKSERAETKSNTYNISCKYCNSNNVRIAFGRSYYIKCNDCDKNTPIRELCQICNQQMRIRKSKQNHYLTCKPCEKETLYFTNSN